MKTYYDIDKLMQQEKVDALIISGAGNHNSAMYYFTNGGNITQADVIKIKGKKPILLHSPIEREEAVKTGLTCISYNQYPIGHYLKKANGDKNLATAHRYYDILKNNGIESGKLMFYGLLEFGNAYDIICKLISINEKLDVVVDSGSDILKRSRLVKNTKEINKIKNVGLVTIDIVEDIKDFISEHKQKQGILINSEGNPLTIGDVKNRINYLIAKNDLENPMGTIFSIGKESSVPHSVGSENEIIKTGETIIFDIFPCERGGGYFHDFTRTWCIGYASDEILNIYENVKNVYEQIVNQLEVNQPFKKYNNLACDGFFKMGYKTLKDDPVTENGFVHSLGHGVGLDIHESPFSGISSNHFDILVPGVVFTIEPGLYFPEKGIGVRLENTLYCNEDGKFNTLIDYPMELIVPLKK